MLLNSVGNKNRNYNYFYYLVSFSVWPAGYIEDMSKRALVSIIGAALSSYNRLYNNSFCGADQTGKFLSLAKRYKSSPPVLSAVAGYLEFKYG